MNKPFFSRKGQSSGTLAVLMGGLVGVVVITIAWVSMMNSASQGYTNVVVDNNQYSSFSQKGNIVNLTNDLNNNFINTNGTGTTGSGGPIETVTASAYTGVRLFVALPGFYYSIFTNIGSQFNIPQEIIALVCVLVTVALIALFILIARGVVVG